MAKIIISNDDVRSVQPMVTIRFPKSSKQIVIALNSALVRLSGLLEEDKAYLEYDDETKILDIKNYGQGTPWSLVAEKTSVAKTICISRDRINRIVPDLISFEENKKHSDIKIKKNGTNIKISVRLEPSFKEYE